MITNLMEQFELGQKFLNSFTGNNIFEGIKQIVKIYIQDDDDLKLLIKHDSYYLEIDNGQVDYLSFIFGKDGEQYEVVIDALEFRISQQEGCSLFSKEIIKIPTYKSIQ